MPEVIETPAEAVFRFLPDTIYSLGGQAPEVGHRKIVPNQPDTADLTPLTQDDTADRGFESIGLTGADHSVEFAPAQPGVFTSPVRFRQPDPFRSPISGRDHLRIPGGHRIDGGSPEVAPALVGQSMICPSASRRSRNAPYGTSCKAMPRSIARLAAVAADCPRTMKTGSIRMVP